MGLKPDHWIRKMSLEHGMIEPFVDSQKREGVISYGVSSYGYDMRVADEFKVFTNVHSAIVDPKNFSPQSFVDIQTDVCIVPPNSFALARSVEYFRIPRSVLTLCVGKSTYARCFRGDTKVALVDGTSISLEDMAKRSEQGEMFFGYSIGQFGRVMVTLLEAPRYIGRDSLIEITLDNGEVIHTTPDHEFIMRDGRKKQADDLRADDSLMPLYRHLARGYEMIYQPANGHLYPTHRLADEWNVRHDIYADAEGTHRHHKDFNRQNNNPWNIERMLAGEHIRLHNDINYGDDFDAEEHGQSVKEAIKRLKMDSDWLAMFKESQRKKATDFWTSDKYEDARQKLSQKHRDNWTDERRDELRARLAQYYANPDVLAQKSSASRKMWQEATEDRRNQQREIARRINLREEITEERVRWALDQTGSIRGASRLLECDRSTFRRFPEVMAAFKGTRTKYRNHRVVSVRSLAGTHDVYCLSVPEAGNFALEAGVFVSNCGIITNVTPFEPGWEGYVTLEISNTTPLPARVYANEGIAQVIFFEADEECEVSYADKAGKYQGQIGVTPPKLG
jgi:deoxycytidine triphosphate deaminase